MKSAASIYIVQKVTDVTLPKSATVKSRCCFLEKPFLSKHVTSFSRRGQRVVRGLVKIVSRLVGPTNKEVPTVALKIVSHVLIL